MAANEKSDFAHRQSGPAALFAPQRPDHMPPQTLADDELALSVDSLRRKRQSARRSYTVAHLAGIALTVVLVALTATVLWYGPEPFIEHVFGHARIATTYDIIVWWFAVIVLAILGGTFGDQLLRGRLRLAHGWKHRLTELDRRLADAEHEQRRRTPA
jgi:hypothetical protein